MRKPKMPPEGEDMIHLVSPPEEQDRKDLHADVALMRRLGVVEWKGIKLGPAPSTEPPPRPVRSPDALAEELQKRREERHRVQFAASSFRPPLFERPAPTVVPRAVSTRSGRHDASLQK